MYIFPKQQYIFFFVYECIIFVLCVGEVLDKFICFSAEIDHLILTFSPCILTSGATPIYIPTAKQNKHFVPTAVHLVVLEMSWICRFLGYNVIFEEKTLKKLFSCFGRVCGVSFTPFGEPYIFEKKTRNL